MMNGPMLRALLEERFRLKFHRETKIGYSNGMAVTGIQKPSFSM